MTGCGSLGDAERDGESGAGVAGGEGVVRAFERVSESRQASFEADLLELVAPPGDHLVGVALVGGVPHDAVDGAVEHAVDRQGELHHPQVRGEVAAALGDDGDDGLADFFRHLVKFFQGERFEVAGGIDLV